MHCCMWVVKRRLTAWHLITEQDGRLAPVYFSPNYKYFDHLLQTVKNKTTVLILVFKEFLQTSIDHWFLYFMQKGITIFRWKNFISQCRKMTGRCHLFLNKTSWQFWSDKKKRNDPTEWIIFLVYFIYGEK